MFRALQESDPWILSKNNLINAGNFNATNFTSKWFYYGVCATLCTLISACDSAVAQIGIFQPIALFSFYGDIHKKALLSLELHQGKEQKKSNLMQNLTSITIKIKAESFD